MDRICRYVCVSVFEKNVHYDQVVYMVQVVSDLTCGDFSCDPSHDKVPSSPIDDLVGNVWWYVELSIVPAEL